MKGAYVALIVFLGVAVLTGGMFFVFGDDTLGVVGIKDQIMDEENSDMNNSENSDAFIFNKDGIAVAAGSGGGGGGSGVSNLIEGVFGCSEWKPVQYSFRNFFEDIECLVYGDLGCEKAKATCKVDISNLDSELGGTFSVGHSLYYEDQAVGFNIAEEYIEPLKKKTLTSEIIVDGNFDIDSFKCNVNVNTIPTRCLD
jgi:hypothetical protein